jgi:formylmethanofuran--tetrahydromethanopterin N-formyltransferase
MGGNIWAYCDSEKGALRIGDLMVEAVEKVPFAITPFNICSAGSKVESNFPEIGPTTNHPFCPALVGKIKDSKISSKVKSIPEVVINGKSLHVVKNAMKESIYSIKDKKGVLLISAGNFGGNLGNKKIFLKDLFK